MSGQPAARGLMRSRASACARTLRSRAGKSARACRAEAVYMDPQQRLLLQQAGEALAAAAPAEAAAGPGTAVMVGIGTVEYTGLAMHLGASNYAATGKAPCWPHGATDPT